MNLYGLLPCNEEKYNMLIQSCKNKQINVMIISEPNAKQNTINKERIHWKLRELHRNIKIEFADSNNHKITNLDQLPGKIMMAFQNNIISLINQEKMVIDKLGKWIISFVSDRYKTIAIIAIYRIPQSLQ